MGKTMGKSLYVVDAFAERAFAGNPAGVCLLEEPAEEAWMQAVAREVNAAATGFACPEGGGLRLRWFTPAVEVALCGHATLATAHVLWETGQRPVTDEIVFQTRSGPLTARRDRDRVVLDFPAVRDEPCPAPPGLLEALRATARYVGKGAFDYLVALEDEAAVRGLQPDLQKLQELAVRGVIVTGPSQDPAFDFVSRFFAPRSGIPEDAVTGSAHCCLGPYWSARLGKSALVGHQVSARGGVVRVEVRGDRVWLGGRAVTIARGELLI
jgi:PhzF family phenazine biosynthesis protein